MIAVTKNDKYFSIDWVYSPDNTADFNECKHWLVIFAETGPEIYGLGFDPFDIEWELFNGDWHWPTNQRLHDVVCKLRTNNELWNIVKPV